MGTVRPLAASHGDHSERAARPPLLGSGISGNNPAEPSAWLVFCAVRPRYRMAWRFNMAGVQDPCAEAICLNQVVEIDGSGIVWRKG